MRLLIAYSIIMAVLFAMPAAAYAYIGPGPGLSMLGSLLGLIGGVFLALVMVLAYPIRLLLKRRKANQHSALTTHDTK
jgi:membrane associated rhomboid family serine protease